MKIGVKNKLNHAFQIASIADIVFLLLVFFLVQAGRHFQSIIVDLPASKNDHRVPASIHVVITKNLEYYVQNQIVPFASLADVLKIKLAQQNNKTVILHMDKLLAISELIKVADLVTGLGAQVSIATNRDQI